MNWILHCTDEAGFGKVGAKGFALASAARAGLPVPPWFAVTPAAWEVSRTPVKDFVLPPALRAELAAAVAQLCPRGEFVAVRSSALDEDGAKASFAGQLESFLFVRPEEVAARLVQVWRSALAAHVLAYRERHGLSETLPPPAVLVQRMVDADAAGVAFSADPVSGRRSLAVVAAVSGVAFGLVSGQRDADTWHVDRSGRIANRTAVGAQRCLPDAQAEEVAALARRCARHFGRPQDIEWALKGGELWLLQSRPITSLAALTDPDAEFAIWDSSNIAESYGGVTTPLTFSFIRRNYEHVYREFCRIGGVNEAVIAENEDALHRMLGLMRGRVHYNLLVWYRLLALVPGFARNRRFLDDMLGVREAAAAPVIERIQAEARRRTTRASLVLQFLKLIANQLTVERRNRRFQRHLEEALAPPAPALTDMRADELASHFRQLGRRLLRRWDAPLVNDFLAMIFHGLLRRLVELWLEPRDRGLDNDLLAGDSGVISVEPARRIRELARTAAQFPKFVKMLCEASVDAILGELPRVTSFHALYRDYLRRFGDRCFEELKLESPALEDDPLPLLRAVGHLATNPDRAPVHNTDAKARHAAEQHVRAVLGRNPLRRLVFGWVLRNARARVRDRENLRFERTRVYGRVRRIFVEIGKRFDELGLLDAPRDVFWLELDEVLGFIEGTAICTDLKGLAALRKAEFERHRRAEELPRRFETRGIAHHACELVRPAPAADAEHGEERRATGCSPGVVRGRVRVVTVPEGANLCPGEILVAERTDPGWVMLFAAAAGLIVERGSLLSHAAIVAREMGLPAVVGFAGACRWLADGDLVELDGTAGTVRRIEILPRAAEMRSAA